MATVSIEFDTEREPTLKEVILLQNLCKGEFQALVELVQLRATHKVDANDIEAVPLSEVREIAKALGDAMGMAAAAMNARMLS